MIDNLLLEILNEKIYQKKEKLRILDNLLFSDLDSLKKEIDAIIKDQELIEKFNLNKLNENIIVSSGINRELKFYQKVCKSNFLELTDSQKNKILNYFIEFKTKIEEKVREIISLNEDYMSLNFEYYKLYSLKEKIDKNHLMNKEDFIVFSDIIKNHISNVNQRLELIKKLALNICNSYENEEKIEKEQIIKISNVKREELETLFLKYDLNFNEFKEKDQEQLLIYASLKNIDSILGLLKENNIRINIELNSKKISQILLLSNTENISIIINNIKCDLGSLKDNHLKLNEIFELYINTPSIFINGIKKYERRTRKNDPNKGTYQQNEFITGALDNYQLNRKMFIDLGLTNINDAIKTCSSVFTESNKKLKTNIEYFKSYGIDKTIYFNTLSSMRSSNPLDVIDQFIEAGCYDYIISCFSRTNLTLNSKELYQLINAKKSNWPDTKIYRYARVGDKKQKQRRATNLNELSSDTLVGEPEYKINLEKNYENVDFQTQELITEKVLNNHFIKTLEENYKNDDLTYDFNGTIISRYKVLRYFAILLKNKQGNLDSLKYAIFKNVIITKTEYDMINNTLNLIFNHNKNYYRLEKKYSDIDFQDIGEIDERLLNNYFIKLLDENFLENDMTYDIEGIIIPRYEVLRNFKLILKNNKLMPNPFDGLIYSIIKGRNFNYNQCHLIAKSLADKHKELKGEKSI